MKICITVLLFVGFFVLPTNVHAALVTVEGGGVYWSVLGVESDFVEVAESKVAVKFKKLARAAGEEISKASVDLTKTGDQIKLRVDLDDERREADVAGFTDEIIEVVKRGDLESLRVLANGDSFVLVHKGVSALTNFGVSVDGTSSKVTLATTGGGRVIWWFYLETRCLGLLTIK